MLFWRYEIRSYWLGLGKGFVIERSWIYVKEVVWFCVRELERKCFWSFFWVNIFYYGSWL